MKIESHSRLRLWFLLIVNINQLIPIDFYWLLLMLLILIEWYRPEKLRKLVRIIGRHENWGWNYSVWRVREVSFGSNYREFWKTKGSENRDSKKYWQFRDLTKYHLPWTIYQTSLICGRVVKGRTRVCTLQSCRKNCAKKCLQISIFGNKRIF